VPQTFTVVGEVVYAALQHRLEVFLHFAAIYIYHKPYRQSASGLYGINVRADNGNLAVLDLVFAHHAHQLKAGSLGAAEFHKHVLFTDGLTLKGRADGDGDININGGNLNSTVLKTGLYYFIIVRL